MYTSPPARIVPEHRSTTATRLHLLTKTKTCSLSSTCRFSSGFIIHKPNDNTARGHCGGARSCLGTMLQSRDAFRTPFTTGQQSNQPNGAVQSGNTMPTAPLQHRNGSVATSSLVNDSKIGTSNGQAQLSHQQSRQQDSRPAVVEDDLDTGCECCARTQFDCDDEELDTVVDGDDDEDYDCTGDWDHESTQSMVPSPPAAPAGAACSLAHSLATAQPLGAKVRGWVLKC